MSEEDTGAPHFATGAEVEALLDKYARDRVGAHTRMPCKVCWYVYKQRFCRSTMIRQILLIPAVRLKAGATVGSMAKFLRSLLAQRIVKPSFGGGRQSRPTPAMMKRIGCTIPPAKASV